MVYLFWEHSKSGYYSDRAPSIQEFPRKSNFRYFLFCSCTHRISPAFPALKLVGRLFCYCTRIWFWWKKVVKSITLLYLPVDFGRAWELRFYSAWSKAMKPFYSRIILILWESPNQNHWTKWCPQLYFNRGWTIREKESWILAKSWLDYLSSKFSLFWANEIWTNFKYFQVCSLWCSRIQALGFLR